MSDLMKGNFEPKKKVTTGEEKKGTLEDRFEKEALKRLGGSIAYVSKQKIKWGKESENEQKSC